MVITQVFVRMYLSWPVVYLDFMAVYPIFDTFLRKPKFFITGNLLDDEQLRTATIVLQETCSHRIRIITY